MANNRLWLVHRPTGKSVFLGKRMALGWYLPQEDQQGPIGTKLQKMFDDMDEAMDGGNALLQDDFILAIEDPSGAPACTDDWIYEDHKPALGDEIKKKGPAS